MKNQRHHARHHVGHIFVLVGLISAAALVLGTTRLASAQAVYPSWSYTGNLNTGRVLHSMTLLPNGKVLVAGGYTCFPCVEINTAELYDPATGSWSYTGNLNTARINHTATLLPNGKVLVVGGFRNVFDRNSLNSAELYDPTTGKWSNTGSLNTARDGQTATLLPNGKVLVAGAVTMPIWLSIQATARSCTTLSLGHGAPLAISTRPAGITRRHCCPVARC
jgi:WD40 repeat protein